MGKTVPSYRMALEEEIHNWKGFKKGLPSDEDKQAFDQVIDMCRMTAMEAQNACKRINTKGRTERRIKGD